MTLPHLPHVVQRRRAARTLALLAPLARACVLILLVACGDAPTRSPAVSVVTVSAPAGSISAGETLQLSATTTDAGGNNLVNRAVTWHSSNGSAATISASGLLSAHAPGSTIITATSEGRTGTVQLFVRSAVSQVQVIAPSLLVTGQERVLAAALRDVNNVYTQRSTTWTSSNSAVLTVADNGMATALSPGEVVVTATSGGTSGSATIAVLSISPAILRPGDSVAISAAGTSLDLRDSQVTIGGVSVNVAATAQTLAMVAPCVNSGDVQVQVTKQNVTTASFTHPLLAPQRSLGVGESVVLSGGAPSACNELTAAGGNARYLVTIFSAATSANIISSVDLLGNAPATGAVSAPVVVSAAQRVPAMSPADPMQATLEGYERVHRQHLERDRIEYERLLVKARSMPRDAPAMQAQAQALPAVGDMRSLFFTFSGGCQDVSRVMDSRAIYVGTRSVIWEDTANTRRSSDDAFLAGFYQRLGQIYDEDQHESVKNNFGDPLLRDEVTDNDGRIHMVFSQRLNGSGAAAYVTSCDQHPTAVAAGSNFGQFFYGSVPTLAGSNVNSTAYADGWFYFMGRTVVHEVKHIASLSARVAKNASFEQSWLEEGTARMAEEMWVRESLHQVGWKANTGWGTAASNGLYCDFHPADATCNAADLLRRPSYGMRRQFNEIRPKLLEPWEYSPYGDGVGQTGSTFYNTVWSLVRYAIDRYGSSDAAFLTTLNNATSTGIANLTGVAGVSADQLIGGWGMALFTDDYPGMPATNPDLQIPTWNFRDIYAGLNAAPNWSARFNTPYPLQPVPLSFGTFTAQVPRIRGGAHAYFEISGSAAAAQLVRLLAPGGAAASADIRVAIARLQ